MFLPRRHSGHLYSNPSPPWEGFLPVSNQTKAVVTTLYSDAYAPAVATLGHSLRRANTSAQMIVLYFPEKIHPDSLCLATSTGFIPHAVNRIAPPHNGAGVNPNFIDQYTKLTLWTMDKMGIDSIVYLDADTLVIHNFDELFAMPYTFGAVPDVFGDRGFILEFNAGVLFVRPDSRVFNAMMEVLPTARFRAEWAEQAFLNQFFSSSAVRLPYIYNGNLAYKSRSPNMWAGIRDHLRVIHYTLYKPFLGKSRTKQLALDAIDARVKEVAGFKRGFFREEMLLWGQYWEETRQAYELIRDKCWDQRPAEK